MYRNTRDTILQRDHTRVHFARKYDDCVIIIGKRNKQCAFVNDLYVFSLLFVIFVVISLITWLMIIGLAHCRERIQLDA